MTTIAWDGEKMCADTRLNHGNTAIPSPSHKIYRLADGSILGAAGSATQCNRLARLLDGVESKVKWSLVTALHVKADGLYLYASTSEPLKIEQGFYAVGSGADYALGAMQYMKQNGLAVDALQAVKVACALDINSGEPVDTERLSMPPSGLSRLS